MSVLGRYVHSPSFKLWHAYHHIAKYLVRTKDFLLVVGNYDPLRRTEPYVFTGSAWEVMMMSFICSFRNKNDF